jgi:NADH (or F420H2) dehydrogenase, subunit C
MTFQEILKTLQDKLGADVVQPTTDLAGDPFATLPAEKLPEVLNFVKDDPRLQMDCLSNLTGVDAPPDHLDVVYHLFSYPLRHSFVLKVRIPKANPKVPTAEKIYPTANWQEREAYDLLGVVFDGHPDLRRIMLPEDWLGHPLRKDYKEEQEYRGITTTRPSLLYPEQ